MGNGSCDGRMLFVCRMLHAVVFEKERWERDEREMGERECVRMNDKHTVNVAVL